MQLRIQKTFSPFPPFSRAVNLRWLCYREIKGLLAAFVCVIYSSPELQRRLGRLWGGGGGLLIFPHPILHLPLIEAAISIGSPCLWPAAIGIDKGKFLT